MSRFTENPTWGDFARKVVRGESELAKAARAERHMHQEWIDKITLRDVTSRFRNTPNGPTDRYIGTDSYYTIDRYLLGKDPAYVVLISKEKEKTEAVVLKSGKTHLLEETLDPQGTPAWQVVHAQERFERLKEDLDGFKNAKEFRISATERNVTWRGRGSNGRLALDTVRAHEQFKKAG